MLQKKKVMELDANQIKLPLDIFNPNGKLKSINKNTLSSMALVISSFFFILVNCFGNKLNPTQNPKSPTKTFNVSVEYI